MVRRNAATDVVQESRGSDQTPNTLKRPPPTDLKEEQPLPKIPRTEGVKVLRSKYIFYPDIYSTFDPSKIVFSKDAARSRDGSGEILWMTYAFADGTKPLQVQTPNAMYSPTGIMMWKDGKSTLLLSAGQDWEQNEKMVEFKKIVDSIEDAAVDAVIEKNWNTGGSKDPSVVRETFVHVMFTGNNKETGVEYPPSMKANVTLDGELRSDLFDFVNNDPVEIVPADVEKGCGVTAIIEFPWVFKRGSKRNWSFNIRSNLTQARIFPPSREAIVPQRCEGYAICS
jgi:hypothetical protein